MAQNDRRKQIMRAVEQLAAKRKLSEITLDEVTKVAKIGKGTIYHYFKDKEDLFFEVAMSGFEDLCELLEEKVPKNASFDVKFHTVCDNFIRFFAGRRQLLQIMQTHTFATGWSKSGFRERWLCRRKELLDALSGILSQGVDEGVIRSDLSAEFLAAVLLGMLRSYVRDLDASFSVADKGKVLMDLFLNGAGRVRNRLAVVNSETF